MEKPLGRHGWTREGEGTNELLELEEEEVVTFLMCLSIYYQLVVPISTNQFSTGWKLQPVLNYLKGIDTIVGVVV